MDLLYKRNLSLLIWISLCLSKADVTAYNGDGYPPLWNITSGNIEDFRNEANKTTINFWNYLDRMSAYRILLNVSGNLLNMTETENKRNVLWGLPLQHGWQYQTGRLEDTSKMETRAHRSMDRTMISPRSWWACMNYYLSAIPFLGAVDAGLFKGITHEIELTYPDESESDFCYSIKDCKASSSEAMEEWKTFFEFIKSSSQRTEGPSPQSPKEDEILLQMWKAHVESIKSGLTKCSKRLNYLSTQERTFGRSWATAVEFIAATQFSTDFENTNTFQVYLPHRLLTEEDKAPNIADFTQGQNMVLSSLQLINKVNTFSGGHLLQLWKKAMCSEDGRIIGRELIQNIATEPGFAVSKMIAIIKELIKNVACDVLKKKEK
ncbi:protein LEG1 homolog [Pelobates fuscus]|uniref:protein LEG1 homolog n=1 Tax=Pelobates fuscus TaxID=191477 RepID=UPI002FE48A67